MTTAARPTFNPAQGGRGRGEGGEGDLSALSKQYSSRDLPAHTKLKYRQTGQSSVAELRGQDFRRDLEARERGSRDRGVRGGEAAIAAGSTSAAAPPPSKRARLADTANLDADDQDDDDDDDTDSDESDDDDAELMAELQKIKRERAAEAARKEEQKRVEEERIRTETILSGNPLLNLQGGASSMKVKRRWDDDVVFKNCAKDENKGKDGTFINDTLRSEFHKKFMSKYVQ